MERIDTDEHDDVQANAITKAERFILEVDDDWYDALQQTITEQHPFIADSDTPKWANDSFFRGELKNVHILKVCK